MNQINILNTKVHDITMAETIKIVGNFISLRKPHQIVTVNPEMIVAAQSDNKFNKIINNSNLVIPDGTGLLWAASFTGQHLTERVTGIDLVNQLANLAAKKRYSIYLLGAMPGVAKKASEILVNKYPGLKIAGYSSDNPVINFPDKPEYKFPYNNRTTDIKPSIANPNLKIVNKIRLTKPDILLVAYGHVKQEKFIAQYSKLLNIPVMIGVGGAFDFIVGIAIRAPRIFQKFGLNYLGFEWLWRLITEPKRFKRIFTAVIVFPWLVFIDIILHKNQIK
ncbi:MAG: hypothetical protein ACD_58C00142G0002 [uncultured bacterium]|nr:MAG: hypothetical protein ACD_58C00142G0002 [uncultured bacterium]